MGQYYEPVCLDKKQYLNSWNFGNGAKLIEHSWRGNNFVEAVVQLLSPGAPWYKKRLVWAGDYADEGKFLDLKWSQKNLEKISNEVNSYQDGKIKDLTLEEKLNYINLYSVANICFKKIVPEDLDKYPSVTGNFFLNHSKKEFFQFDVKTDTLNKLDADFDDWIMHPLPLLVCDGNKRGGGDYYGSDPEELVGHWAGDIISVESVRPSAKFMEIFPVFKE